MDKQTINYLGIDWGEKRIGLASADSELKLALPLGTVPDLAGVIQALNDEAINIIVIGQPNKMSGQTEGLTPAYENFIRLLKEQTNLEIKFVDERLTSQEADALGGPKKLRAGRDEIAAAIILQAYLDRLVA
jgi:putative holliday junction resolvase